MVPWRAERQGRPGDLADGKRITDVSLGIPGTLGDLCSSGARGYSCVAWKPETKQEALAERGLTTSASFPEVKAACQGLRAPLVLISPQPQIIEAPSTSSHRPHLTLHL